jgi:hypothetical protein
MGVPRFCTMAAGMAVTIELQNTGDSVARAEVVAVIEHVLSDRHGDWRVSILGTRASEHWNLKIEGPAGFERSYSLDVAAGEHRPDAIRKLLLKLLPANF